MPSTNNQEPTIYKKNTNIQVLQEKKVLSFPEYLGNSSVDESGNDYTYMIIKINTATVGSKLKEDTDTGPVVIANTQQGATMDASVASSSNAQYVDKDVLLMQSDGEAYKKESWVKKPGLSRLDRVIVLPMPSDYRVDTDINYNDTEEDLLSKIGDAGKSLFDGTGASDLMKMGISGMASGLINAATAAAFGKDITSFDKMAARGRAALNPKKETLFKDLDFRKFGFQYTLAPRNANESQIVQEIIQTFRYYALPELSESKLFYTFPAEFEIMLMQGSRENPSIPRIAPSILKRVSVNYAPSGVWSNLRDGMPVQVTLSLEFQELELIDRNRVWSSKSKITSGY